MGRSRPRDLHATVQKQRYLNWDIYQPSSDDQRRSSIHYRYSWANWRRQGLIKWYRYCEAWKWAAWQSDPSNDCSSFFAFIFSIKSFLISVLLSFSFNRDFTKRLDYARESTEHSPALALISFLIDRIQTKSDRLRVGVLSFHHKDIDQMSNEIKVEFRNTSCGRQNLLASGVEGKQRGRIPSVVVHYFAFEWETHENDHGPTRTSMSRSDVGNERPYFWPIDFYPFVSSWL